MYLQLTHDAVRQKSTQYCKKQLSSVKNKRPTEAVVTWYRSHSSVQENNPSRSGIFGQATKYWAYKI